MDGMLTFQMLNDDVLTEIFKFLTMKDIAVSQMVSKEWKACTEKPFIWRRVQYDFQKNEIENVREYIRWFIDKLNRYDVQELIINDIDQHLTFHHLSQIFSHPHLHLHQLILSIYNLDEYQDFTLSQLLVQSCPNLISFSTFGSFLKDHNMKSFSSLKHLHSFSIMGDDNTFRGTHLKNLPPLKKVNTIFILKFVLNTYQEKHIQLEIIQKNNSQ